MSRRDTILMAVLVNAALLALLFMAAVSPESETVSFVNEESSFATLDVPVQQEVALVHVTPYAPPKDEIDHLLVASAALVEEPDAEPLKRFADYVEVTVKRGDVLERIARANKTTVTALKKINNLKSERIDVGQILKVPVGQQAASAVKSAPIHEADKEFYVVQEGDNPWKIAKQFHVGFEELLDLNQLDEVKARNLKVGDQIRVH